MSASNLSKEVFTYLLKNPGEFEIWFGCAYVGKKFSVILSPLRSVMVIQVRQKSDPSTPKDVQDARGCIEIPVPFFWRGRMIWAVKSLASRKALEILQSDKLEP